MGLIRRRIEGDKDLEHWSDVEPIKYRALGGPLGYKNIVIGPDDGSESVAMRIFQIPKGKHSREEEHPHDHLVYIIEGSCQVLLGDQLHAVEAGDVVWVKPNEHHRFDNVGETTLKFLCAIPAWGEQDSQKQAPGPQAE